MSDVLRAWVEYDRGSTGLLAEASGWGAKVDQDDDESLLAWAREYLPRVMAHAAVTPGRTMDATP